MVISSHSWKIFHLVGDVDDAAPFSLSLLMILKRWLTSFLGQEGVGSSMMTILAS